MTDSSVNELFNGALCMFAATCVIYLSRLRRHSDSKLVSISEADTEDWEHEDEYGSSFERNRRISCSRPSFADLTKLSRSFYDSTHDSFESSDFHDHFEKPEDNPPSTDGYNVGKSYTGNPNRSQSTLDLSMICNNDKGSGILPKRLILIRHGQSEGNLNEKIYSVKPDNALRLTKLGWDQAQMAGKTLKKELIGDGEPVHFIISPYVRTVETLHGLLSAWCDPQEFSHIEDEEKRKWAWYNCLHTKYKITWHEDPRIREQDFGNYQNHEAIAQAKRERNRFGAFYYRFPNGESASDVYDRVSTFLDSLWRGFHSQRRQNYVIVTHGISIRVLLSRYFRYTIDQFHTLANPKNCEMVILGHDEFEKLKLKGRCELVMEKKDKNLQPEKKSKDLDKDSSQSSLEYDFREAILRPSVRDSILKSILSSSSKNGSYKVTGYKFYNKLRILPTEYITRRETRISYPKR